MRLGILTALLILFHMQHVFHCSPSVVPGYLDFDNLPDTNFSCEGKVIGGYYADIETGCQMFHVCTIGQKGEVTDIKFLCLNGTVFDQETRVCERVDEVDCSKTEGFYDLNLELYGNNAALSFPEEEEEDENTESQENAESNDGQNSQQKTSTSKPLSTPPPSSTPLTPHPIHPASTTTPKTPIHPFVPTTTVPTYKPNQHITHFHSTTAPSIAAFLAINNAFSSSNSNQDNTSQYDDDDEEGEEVEDDDSITDPPGIGINNEANHRFPVTTVSSQIRPIGPQQHNVLQPNVKVQGTGESGFILNQANRPQQTFQSSKTPATSTQSSHLYHNYPTPASSKNPNAHSKHQLNTQLILNQQKENENKQHHGFRPITNPDNRNQFLFSSTTRQPPIYFTTKNPTGYSTTIRPQIEPFSLHAIGPQPSIQTTQQAPSNSPFPQQTNAHQVPANPLVQQIRSNIANNGGFLAQTIQLSQSPLTFQFNSNNNNNNRQGHQLFTTPSIAVIATTSSTSSSSSVKSSPTGKTGNISPIISLTSSIGSTPKVSVPNNSSVSDQLFSETTPPNSYDEYQEGDVSSDPFFRDVPKLSKPSTQLKSPVPTRHGVVRRKRRTLRDIHGFLPKSLHLRIKRKAQVGLPTEIFGTGEGRYRNRPEGQERSYVVESSRNAARNSRTRIDPQSRKITVAEPIKHIPVAPSSGRRLRPHVYDTTTPEATTLLPEIPQQIPQFAILDSALPSSAPQYSSDSAILKTPPRSDIQHDHRRKVIKVRRPLKQNDPEEPGLSSLGALSYQNSEQHLSFQTPTTTRPIKSFEILSENAQVPTHSETVQEISRNVPRGRVQNQEENQRHQQPTRSFSNLEQEAFTGQRAGTLRQRSRQRITSSHDVGLNDANRRIDHSSSGSELQDRSSSRSHGRTSNARGQGRYFSAPHAVAHSRTGSVKFTEPFEANTEIANGTTVKPPPPLPETNFTCTDKIAGGYYADLEADCQLFHICSLGRHGRLQDNKFFCGPGTRFNQRSRTCQARDLVDCTVSASLYYLNNNFRLPIEDDASKYNIGFEPKKVRSKRKAPKAIGNAESTYSIDNLPETSFTCADKPQDGLYADVETQCHVFHLCRTISGVITLDGSFVCPPGTIFNQPEGNCDTMKEVDCALYSAPEHAFRKTSAAHKNQGSKARAKRHDIDTGKEMKYESFKLKKNTNFKKLVALMNKKLRLRRSTSDEEDAIDNYGIRMKLHETGKNTRPIVTGFKLKKNTNFKKLITLSNKKHRLKRENDDIDNYNIRAKWHKTGNDKIFKLKKNIQFKKLATQLDKKHRLKRDTSGRKETIDYYDYVDDNYEAHVSKPINRPELLAVKKDQISQSNINVANTEEYVYDEDYDSAAISSVKEMREEPYTGSQQTENVGNEELPPERTIVPVDTTVITNEEHTSPPLPLTTVPGNEVNHTSSDVNTSSADTAVEYEYEYEYEDETTVASTTRSSAKEERNVEENNDRKIDVRLTTSNNGVSDFTRSTTLPSEGRISGHYITVTNTEDNTASKSKVSDDLNGKFKTIDNLNTETVPLENATPLAITTPSNGLKDVEDYSRSSNQIMETTQTPVLYSSITPNATFPTNLIENTNLEENQFTKRTMNQVETTTPVSIQTSSVPLEEVEYEYYYDDEDIEESNTTQKAPSKELLPPKIEFPVNEFKSTTIRSNEEHRSNNGKEPLQDIVKDKDFGENENLSHPENISGTQSTESTKADNEKIEYLEKSVVPVDTISDVSEERGKSEDKLVVQIKATPEPILKIPFREAHFPEQTTLPIHSFIPPSRENPKIKENKSDIVTSDPKLSPTDLFPELFETHTNPTFLQELDRNSAVTSRRNRINENIPINDDITIASLSTQLHKKSPISISEEEISTVASTTEETVITDTETMVPAPFKTITPHPTTLGLHESTTSKELKTYNPTIITTAEPLQETTPTLFTTTHITPHRPRNGRIKQSRRTSTRRPNLENDINTDTITVLTSTEPSRVTVPTTIPSLFRPSKQREVFRNRYATPDPPPVVIQARDNVSPRKPTRNRNRNTYTGNNFRNDEAKSRNAHRFSVQSSEIPETEKPLRVHSRRRTTTTSTTTTTVSPTVVVENPTVTDQVASSQNTVPSIHSSEPREFQESSTVPYVALSTYNETEDQTNVSFPPTRNSIVNLKSLNVKDDLSSETIDSSKLSTLVVSEGLDKTTLVKGIFSSTLNPLSTDDIVSINHAIGDNFPVETPTGKEYVFTQQNIGDEHTFSGNDIATPIPITTSTSNINETENTSLPSHLGYTLSSVNSQPSVAYNNNNDNYYNNSTGFVCTGKELHRYHPDPDDCRMFHYCSPGFHTRQVLDFRFTCENGTAFKADTQKCENETLVSNCRHQQS